MSGAGELKLQSIDQVGIVVPDIDEATKRYSEQFGIGPWDIFMLGPGATNFVRGQDIGPFSVKIAWARLGSLTIELLQPVSGPTVQKEFLDQLGEGLHHLGVAVPDVLQAAAQMRELGYEELTSYHGLGPEGKGVAIYFDTRQALGAILELMPARRVG